MRSRIMISVINKPKNANQISSEIGVNYRTVEHHLKVLKENNMISVMGNGYGKIYFPGELIENNYEAFMEILKRAGYTLEGK